MNQPEQGGADETVSNEAQQPSADTKAPVTDDAVPGETQSHSDTPAAPTSTDGADSGAPAGPAPTGPLAARSTGPLAGRKPGVPGSPAPAAGRPGGAPPSFDRQRSLSADPADDSAAGGGESDGEGKPKGKRDGKHNKGKDQPRNKQIVPPPKPKVAVPSKRAPLGDDLEAELAAELAGSGLDDLLGEDAAMPKREQLEDGQRLQATVIKKTPDVVFFALGGPDEGSVPFVQFETEPEIGDSVEVVVRGFSNEDGLYVLVLPGQAVEASDWDDLDEGAVVEAYVAATCNGGVEAKVGSLKGFIPISQLSEFRTEDASEYVDKKLMCVVTECNPRRRNLVLSHRAILEREREELRAEQMEKIAVGDTLEGTVRKVLDFGAFVDLGGVEGLIHISKLSWERIKHPSEVIEEGQKVKVKIEKIDPNSGKIGLSYRDLLDHPWDNIDAQFPLNTTARGVVSRVADFGAFVRLATGIEGLIHISELAHHRVVRVSNVVNEGDEIEVKILSVDRESERIGLSLKATQVAPETEKKDVAAEEAADEPRPEPAIKKQHEGPLKGGTEGDRGGSQFGLKW